MVPKLVAEDIPLLFSLLNDVFPQVQYKRAQMTGDNNKSIKIKINVKYLFLCGYFRIERTNKKSMPRRILCLWRR